MAYFKIEERDCNKFEKTLCRYGITDYGISSGDGPGVRFCTFKEIATILRARTAQEPAGFNSANEVS
jgi:hypothetical protein